MQFLTVFQSEENYHWSSARKARRDSASAIDEFMAVFAKDQSSEQFEGIKTEPGFDDVTSYLYTHDIHDIDDLTDVMSADGINDLIKSESSANVRVKQEPIDFYQPYSCDNMYEDVFSPKSESPSSCIYSQKQSMRQVCFTSTYNQSTGALPMSQQATIPAFSNFLSSTHPAQTFPPPPYPHREDNNNNNQKQVGNFPLTQGTCVKHVLIHRLRNVPKKILLHQTWISWLPIVRVSCLCISWLPILVWRFFFPSVLVSHVRHEKRARVPRCQIVTCIEIRVYLLCCRCNRIQLHLHRL